VVAMKRKYIYLDLESILEKEKISQKQLAKKTGLFQSQISKLVRNETDSINRKHLSLVMKALNINDFNEILKKD
jgi:DNA-binding protein